MSFTAKLQEMHGKLWAFRREMADTWPTPNEHDSLKFAVSEAGEVCDAQLRTTGGYARNNHKEPDVSGEAADLGMMLLTALGPDYRFVGYLSQWVSLEGAVAEVGLAWNYHIAGDKWKSTVECALDALMWSVDLPAELEKRLSRIRAKHGHLQEVPNV